jgi:hypothetical protein
LFKHGFECGNPHTSHRTRIPRQVAHPITRDPQAGRDVPLMHAKGFREIKGIECV